MRLHVTNSENDVTMSVFDIPVRIDGEILCCFGVSCADDPVHGTKTAPRPRKEAILTAETTT